jgi:hypothetical protein
MELITNLHTCPLVKPSLKIPVTVERDPGEIMKIESLIY